MTFDCKEKEEKYKKKQKKSCPNCAIDMTKRDIYIAHMKCDIAPCIYGCHSDFMAKD